MKVIKEETHRIFWEESGLLGQAEIANQTFISFMLRDARGLVDFDCNINIDEEHYLRYAHKVLGELINHLDNDVRGHRSEEELNSIVK